MKTPQFFLPVIALLLSVGTKSSAQEFGMPQDRWWSDYPSATPTSDFIPGRFQCVALGPDGNVYLGTNGTAVSVWTADPGTNCTFVRQFGSLQKIRGLAVDSQTNTYVMNHNGTIPTMSVFGPTGALIRSWGGIGANDFQFGANGGSSHTEIAVDASDRLIVADTGNNRILVYAPDGSLFSKWGPGSGPAQLNQPNVVVVLPNQHILVRSGPGMVFDVFGNLILAGGINSLDLGVTPEGLVASQSTSDRWNYLELRDPFDQSSPFLLVARPLNPLDPFGAGLALGITFDRSGRLFYIANHNANSAIVPGLCIGSRKYAADLPLNRRVVPQPKIVRVGQRTNSSLVDIDFAVLDADSSIVQVAPLAFLNGGSGLDSVVPMTIFAENTATNLGTNVTANTTHRIVWDSTEGVASFANLQFEMLANDGRGLLGFHFITLPDQLGGTNVSIGSMPVMNEDMLNLWFWLVAIRDQSILFTNGVVKAVGGAFAGQSLASGTTTTDAGRFFLYEKLHVRQITYPELIKAQNGNYGFRPGYVDNNSVVKLP